MDKRQVWVCLGVLLGSDAVNFVVFGLLNGLLNWFLSEFWVVLRDFEWL